MDLTFQVPMQCCSLQHWTLFPSHVTYTYGWCFRFGSIPSFFLELLLYSSPVVYLASANWGSSSSSVISLCLLILFMGFSRQNTEVVCHSLFQWATFCQNSPAWPICPGWPYAAWQDSRPLQQRITSSAMVEKLRFLLKIQIFPYGL